MKTGVLIYCFNTAQTNYHTLAERCVEQVRAHLGLDITIVTNISTFKKFRSMGMINYKLIDEKKGNTRAYKGRNIPWYNKERCLAYEHSPYDTTILLDCDYFVFSDFLSQLANTSFDFMLHNRVNDLTGKNMIEGKDEATLPLVWATVTLFRKTEKARIVFDMIKHVQEHYAHYSNLYRIRYPNYRNDYAFAIALHQLNIGHFIPTPMAMLADKVSILDSDVDGVVFQHEDDVNFVSGQDIHIMEKEWCDD